MKASKKRKLLEAGWAVGNAPEFLGLSEEEAVLVQLKLQLARGVRQRRMQAGLTQTQLAERIGSSQSRIAKLEAGDPSVTIDLCVKTLLALGARLRDIAALISRIPESRWKSA